MLKPRSFGVRIFAENSAALLTRVSLWRGVRTRLTTSAPQLPGDGGAMASEVQMLPGSPGSPAKLPSEKASEYGSSPTTSQRRDEARAASVQRILEVP
jgi:hypothetical protein